MTEPSVQGLFSLTCKLENRVKGTAANYEKQFLRMEAIMENKSWEITRLELKYCERCGGLWLRQRGTGRVYCAVCTSEVPKFPFCRLTIRRPYLRVNGQLEVEGQGGALHFPVSGGGGLA